MWSYKAGGHETACCQVAVCEYVLPILPVQGLGNKIAVWQRGKDSVGLTATPGDYGTQTHHDFRGTP
jgi:hypothetical protein